MRVEKEEWREREIERESRESERVEKGCESRRSASRERVRVEKERVEKKCE